MTRLDGILYRVTCKERETKRQRRELQAKLWDDLMKNRPENHAESAHEALNTKLFLALEAQCGTEEKDDFLPVFPTQIPEWELSFQHSEKNPRSSVESLEEEDHQGAGEEPLGGSHGAAPRGTKKQKDFVRRNTEQHASREDDDLTQADRERLTELLQEIDREEEDGAKGADSEGDTCAESGLMSGGGYMPEPSEQDQLMEIDSKIQQLSVKEFVPSQDSSTNLSLSQGRGAEASWKCDWGRQPAERVLQDIKAWRGLEQRLREIQQQLDVLGQSQEMTSELPDLTEEQLLSLLDECDDPAEGCSQNLE
ncbi:fibrous sheath-interacting protein 1 [Nelusetta ayraudi]|uniref:fibrous sheath-interacting protein 1 n=1 Tax=Nelusetta ayraudi TaxID=303726 RepID=UPI003F72671F